MNFEWNEARDKLASAFIGLHFGDAHKMSFYFPCMRAEYPWSRKKSPVLDSRVAAKNNTEYHGLESLAKQYHVSGQYEYAYHHWLIAALWRNQDIKANDFKEKGHLFAVEFAVMNAEYNRALAVWQNAPETMRCPEPEDFGISSKRIDDMDNEAQAMIDEAYQRAASSEQLPG